MSPTQPWGISYLKTYKSKLSLLDLSPRREKAASPAWCWGHKADPVLLPPTPCSLLPGVSGCASSSLSCGAGACVPSAEGYSCLCNPGYTLDPSRLHCIGRLASPLPAGPRRTVWSFRFLGGGFLAALLSPCPPAAPRAGRKLAGSCCGDCLSLSSFLACAQMKMNA